jgi:HD-GYP domain-containing protein (c-di-GMP phosphodiesterase class II)
VTAHVAALEPAEWVVLADDARLDLIAEAFARVVDAKSPFTSRHSERVAETAVGIATVLGLGSGELRDLRRAPGSCTTSESSASRTRSSTSPES